MYSSLPGTEEKSQPSCSSRVPNVRKVLQSKSNSDLEPFKNLIKTLGQYDARKLELMATSLFLSKSAYNFNNTNLVEHIKHLKSEQNYTTTEIEDSLQYLYDHGFMQKP